MVDASKNHRIRVGNRSAERREKHDGTEPAMGFGAVRRVGPCRVVYLFERCLMRAVSSWTWS